MERGPVMAGGRKLKLTPATQDKICGLIRAGHFKETAAMAAGINPATFYDWVAKGNATKGGVYHEFAKAVAEAEAQSELLLVDRILREGGAKGALQVLKRRFRERWGDRVGLEHSGPGGKPIETKGTQAVQVVIGDAGDVWNLETMGGPQPATDDDIPDDDEDAA